MNPFKKLFPDLFNKRKTAEQIKLKRQIDQRVIVDTLTKPEHEKLKELRMNIQVFGTYDHMELESTNKITSEIADKFKAEHNDLKIEILRLHGFNEYTHCIWTDGVITEIPENIDDLKKSSDKIDKENKQRMENNQLDAMSKYGFQNE